MPVITFQFADPTPSGGDVAASGKVRCALLEAQVIGGTYRSTQEFTVPLVAGVAQATLASGIWHVSVEGVSGVVERWVIVPATPASIAFAALADVDLSTVEVTPDTAPRWGVLETRVAALELGGGGVTVAPDPAFPWAVVLSVVTRTAPTVMVQPSAATVGAGSAATFTAAASGDPTPTAQWQVQDETGWSDIVGATSSSYTVPSPQLGDSGKKYRCVFTNSAGSATTAAATLTVTASGGGVAPTISIASVAAPVEGSSWLVDVVLSGTPTPTLTWQVARFGGTQYATTATFLGTVSGKDRYYVDLSPLGAVAGGDRVTVTATATNPSGSASSAATEYVAYGD